MCIPFDELTNDQQAIIIAIFSDPPRSDVLWSTVLELFSELGSLITTHEGLVSIASSCGKERMGVFSYAGREGFVSRQMIQYLRDYLCEVGVQPN